MALRNVTDTSIWCHRSPSRQSKRDTDSEDEGSIKKLVRSDAAHILLIARHAHTSTVTEQPSDL